MADYIISGSAVSTGSFGYTEVDNSLLVGTKSKVAGFSNQILIEGPNPSIHWRDNTGGNQATQFYTIFSSNGNIKHFFDDSKSIAFSKTSDLIGNGETEIMRITSDGNVGIGTATVDNLLHLYHASLPQLKLENSEREFIISSNTGDDLLSFYYAGANRLQFNTTNQYFPTGNVGIGTSNPQAQLHLAKAAPQIMLEDTDVSGLKHTITGGGNAGLEIGVDNNNTGAGYFRISLGGAQRVNISEAGLAEINLGVSGSVASTGSFGAGLYDGNVGIGTTNTRGRRLTVEAAADTSNDQLLYLKQTPDDYGWSFNINGSQTGTLHIKNVANGTESDVLMLTQAGNFGVGTNNSVRPQSRFQVRVGTNQNLGFNSTGGVFRVSAYNDAVNANVPLIINASYLRLSNSDSEVVRITGAKVGIGNTTPSEKLDVTGNIKASGNISGSSTSTGSFGHIKALSEYSMEVAEYISHFEDADTHIRFQNNNLDLTAGGNMVRLNTTGVGIGTASPNRPLHVYQGTAGDKVAVFQTAASGNTQGVTIGSGTNGNDGQGLHIGYGQATDIGYFDAYDWSAGAYQKLGINNFVFINAQAGLGIGNSSPDGKLHVQGGNWNTSVTIKGAGATSGIKFLDSSNNVDGYIYASDGTIALLDSGGDGTIEAVNDSYIRFRTNGGTEHMRITNTGNVGIGTTSPESILHIANGSSGAIGAKLIIDNNASDADGNGTEISFFNAAGASAAGVANSRIRSVASGNTNGYSQLQFWTYHASEAQRMVITSNGNVGIGTATPTNYNANADNLVIYEAGNAGITIATGTGNTGAIYFADGTTGDEEYKGLIKYNHSTNKLTFGANSVDYMTIIPGGSVGIGTTSPSAKLHVIGDTIITGNLTAKQLIVSSSVTNMTVAQASGSTIFGDTVSTDIHQFSGSLNVTGSITLNGSSVTSGGGGGGGVTISNNVNNRVLTGDGTNANAEANLIFNGSELDIRRASDGIALQMISTVGDADEFIDFKMISGNTNSGAKGTIFRHQRQGTGGGDMIIMTNPTLNDTPLETIRFTSDQNVAIGSGTPTGKLQVSSDGATLNQIRLRHIGSGTNGVLDLSVTDTAANIIANYSSTAIPLRFYTGASERMRITSTGNVGIGVTNPAGKLDVAGETFISSGRKLRFGGAGSSLATYSTQDGIFWGTSNDSTFGIFKTAGSWSAPNYQQLQVESFTGIILDPGSSYGKSYVDIIGNGLRVTSGNVGIGTASPAKPFHLYGGGENQVARFESSDQYAGIELKDSTSATLPPLISALGNDFRIYGGHASARPTIMTLLSTGNVGIGVTSPGQKLEIDSGNIQLSNGQQLQWGDGNNAIFGHASQDYIQIKTDATDRVKITSAGLEVFTGNVSGSSTSTGSFGSLIVADKVQGNLTLGGTSIPTLHLDGLVDAVVRIDKAASYRAAHLRFDTAGTAKWFIGTPDSDTYGDGDELYFGISQDTPIVAIDPNASTGLLNLTSNKISGSASSTGSFGAGFFGGNVGVGIDPVVTGFDRVLHLAGTSTAIVRFTATNYGNTSNDGGYIGLNFGGIDIWQKENNYMRFGTNNTERVRILAGGNVGIGTTSPGAKLEVNGGDVSTSLVIRAGGSTGGIRFYDSGGATDGYIQAGDGYIGFLDMDGHWGVRHVSNSKTEFRVNNSIIANITANGMDITGKLTATSKSFLINHPTKENKKLQYASLEGPENGVYVRGKFQGGKYQDNIIDLPDYWVGLVDEDTITINLTPVGKYQQLYVEDIKDNQVFIKSADDSEIKCFYTIYGERKDIEKLEVEF